MGKTKVQPVRCTSLICGRDIAKQGHGVKDRYGNLFCGSTCMVRWWGKDLPEDAAGWSRPMTVSGKDAPENS